MIEREYMRRCLTPSDINMHLPVLRGLAEECQTIVELGTRSGNSTTAFLAGKPKRLTCYDLSFSRLAPALQDYMEDGPTRCEFVWANTMKLAPDDIPECDLLFIDTLHTGPQIAHELTFACRARKYLVIHDTVKYWWDGENQLPGIGAAILNFLDSPDGRAWALHAVYNHNNGLAVFRREAQP